MHLWHSSLVTCTCTCACTCTCGPLLWWLVHVHCSCTCTCTCGPLLCDLYNVQPNQHLWHSFLVTCTTQPEIQDIRILLCLMANQSKTHVHSADSTALNWRTVRSVSLQHSFHDRHPCGLSTFFLRSNPGPHIAHSHKLQKRFSWIFCCWNIFTVHWFSQVRCPRCMS